MIIIKNAQDLTEYITDLKNAGLLINFVPTMGALHNGHISLLKKAQEPNTKVVSSIFVNPTQFNNAADFEKYPHTVENDIFLLEKNGTDLLFLPSVKEMYPDGTERTHPYDLGYLETILEGKYRPGHFQGVCQVVDRLLNIVQPNQLLLGQKDYQQCMVLQTMITTLNLPVKIVIGETLRETDGLAMSSRNMRLSPEQRNKAPLIYQALSDIKEHISNTNVSILKIEGINKLTKAGFKADYIEVADATTLLPVADWNGSDKLVILAAAYLDDIRLIDNLLV